MSESRCINCMKKMEAGITCPHCGALQQADENYPYAMRPNTILHGKYLIGRVLGQGGFGITYVGFDLALEMKVAVKEYFPQGLAGRNISSSQLVWNKTQLEAEKAEQGVKAFLKEARQMAKLDRLPAIVRVRDTFPDNGTAYIVMDFVEGETLKNCLKRSGPMSFEACVQFLDPLLLSLEKMHERNLIHRDISPDNIMVQPDGTPCLLDLGAAKDLAGNETLSSRLVIKRGFSPLEQCTKGGAIGSWTDIYALCATIYCSITDKPVPNVMDRVYSANYGNSTEGVLDFTTSSGKPLPPSVRSVLMAGLALRVEDRIQTVGELRQALENACREISYDRDSGSNESESGGSTVGESGCVRKGTELGNNRTELESSGIHIEIEHAGITESESGNTEGAIQSDSRIETESSGGTVTGSGDRSTEIVREGVSTGNTDSGTGSGSDAAGKSGKSKKKLGLIAAAAAVVLAIGIAAGSGNKGGASTNSGSGNVMMADAYNSDEDVHYVLGSSYEREDIYTITFVDSIEENSTAWDVSADGDGSVIAWVETNDSGYNLYIGGEGGVDLESGAYLFQGYESVETIDFGSGVYTGNVTNMRDMFAGCISLTSLDLSSFDTSAVRNMYEMFFDCFALTELDLSSFDTSGVTNMAFMFYGCGALTELDLTNFDISALTFTSYMFEGCGVSAEDAGLE